MPDITISEGSTLEVDYEVENVGDDDGDQDILLEVQNALEDTDANVALAPGGIATGTLEWPTQDGDAVTNAIAEVVSTNSTDGITVTVEEGLTFTVYDFDSDTLGDANPGPWTSVNGTNAVSDAQAFSGSQSMYLQASGGGNGSRFIDTSFTAGQYTDTFGFLYYETTNNSKTALEFVSSSGDTLLFVGTNNPNVVVEGAGGYNELYNPALTGATSYDRWREFQVVFDWANTEADITWIDRDGSAPTQSATVSLKSASTYDLAEVAVTEGGDAGSWGGSGQDCYVDDVAIYTS
jgi:hypothetical protein